MILSRIFNYSSYYFNPYAVPMFITACLIELFGLYVFLQSKNRVGKSFLILTTSVFIWQAGIGVMYLTKDTTLIIPFYNAFTFLGVTGIAPGIYMFTVSCLDCFEEKKPYVIANYVIAMAIYALNLTLGWLVTGVKEYFWGNYVLYSGPLSIPFLIFFAAVLIQSLHLLYQSVKQTKPSLKREELKLLLISLIIAVLGTVDFISCFPPLEVYPFGFLPVLTFIGLQAYAIIHYQKLLLDQIYGSLREGLIVVDRQCKIKKINPPAVVIIGLESNQLLNKNLKDVFPLISDRLEEPKQFNNLLKKIMLDNSQSIDEDISLREPIQYFHITSSPIIDRFGYISGNIILLNDITERKMLEQELRQYQEELEELVEARTEELKKSEERYKALISHAQVGIGIHREGRMVFANQQFLSMLGYSEEELIGMPISQIIHPEDVRWVIARAYDRYKGKQVIETYDFRILRKDGTVLPVMVSNAIIDYDQEKSTLITVMDTTDSKLRKDLEAINRELEMFAYSVSHDLRAPLRSIDGFSRALQEDYETLLDEEGKDYLLRIRGASQRMDALINDVLILSRLGRSELSRQDVDLSAIAHDIAQELKESEPSRQVKFIIAEGINVIGDKNLLRVAMENLMGNAWKFTQKHKSAKIEFGVIDDDNNPIYFVRDDGVGFDMKYADKLFIPFQRLHSDKEAYEGTGIGLASVQRVIRLHGGKIWAESAIEMGTTFYFTLK